MSFELIVCIAVGLLVSLSVLIKPNIRIKNVNIGLYWLIPLIGAIVLLMSSKIEFKVIFDSLTSSHSINPIKILILFFSMTLISIFLDEIGFFRFLASWAIRKNGKKQIGLFISLYVIISILTVFTSNDIVILTFTPFICLFAKNANVNPVPYLVSEFVAANTFSMLFIIGNPTNIYLASSANISFIDYFKVMAFPTIFGGITAFLLLFLIFNHSLKRPMVVVLNQEHIEDKTSLIIGLSALSICTILLVISSYLNFEMYLIAFFSAFIMIITILVINLIKARSIAPLLKTFKRLPYELIPFVLSMFVIVISLDIIDATKYLANFIQKGDLIINTGISSFLFANVINNIPMSVLFSKVLEVSNLNDLTYLKGVYAAIIGSNIGAYFTPVGALAGIMWSSIIKKYNIHFPFKKFVLFGFIIAIPTLIVTLFALGVILGF